ncbi:MAG: thioesterase [Chloroflexi bacterium]|nr:thioesterase [Chloroflexota bacterium]
MPPDQRPLDHGTLAECDELRREWVVGPSHLYNPSGQAGHEVLSSPSMIMEMETTCAALAKAGLPAGLTTVGFHVDVKHVAPAKPGAAIATTARLISIEGRKLTFAVDAREGDRLVGTGRHRRAVVSVDDLG